MKINRKQKKSTARTNRSATTYKVDMSNKCLTSNDNSTIKCSARICDDGSMEFQSKNAKSTPKGMTLEEEIAYIDEMAITRNINELLKGGEE